MDDYGRKIAIGNGSESDSTATLAEKEEIDENSSGKTGHEKASALSAETSSGNDTVNAVNGNKANALNGNASVKQKEEYDTVERALARYS
jgi:hypothetical protein